MFEILVFIVRTTKILLVPLISSEIIDDTCLYIVYYYIIILLYNYTSKHVCIVYASILKLIKNNLQILNVSGAFTVPV